MDYTKEQMLGFVDSWNEKEWPEDFRVWMNDQMAYEIFDRWINSVDDEDYLDLARDLIDNRIGEKK